MNQFTKLLSYCCLLIGHQCLYTSQLTYHIPKQRSITLVRLSQPERRLLVIGYSKKIHIMPNDVSYIYDLIQYFLHDNPLQYQGKELPLDLSGQDLRGFDFTGCLFTHTNLNGANLGTAIFSDTICDYELTYEINFMQAKICSKEDYLNKRYLSRYKTLLIQLKKIKDSYGNLRDTQKAQLLHLASGLAWMPFHNKQRCFLVYCQYLAQAYDIIEELKQERKSNLTDDLLEIWYFPLSRQVKQRIEEDCWRITTIKNNQPGKVKTLPSSFVEYLKDFKNGLNVYGCQSKNRKGFTHYQNSIIRYIKRLKNAYSHIVDQDWKKETLETARLLSVSYQYEKSSLYQHYTYCLARLVNLKEHLKGKKNMVALRYVRHSFKSW